MPFQGPFAIGHECIAEVLETGSDVTGLHRGDAVVVPWAVSCGGCRECARGLTAECATTRTGTLAAFGFGPASGPWVAWSPTGCASRMPITCSYACPRASTRCASPRPATTCQTPGAASSSP
ncbi:alcohol dehydrogenase catalytic domain-containing protein [Nocardia sp. 2YAB30]